VLPKNILPNAPIQLWNFLLTKEFLPQTICEICDGFMFLTLFLNLFDIDIMALEVTTVHINTELFLNSTSVVVSVIFYR